MSNLPSDVKSSSTAMTTQKKSGAATAMGKCVLAIRMLERHEFSEPFIQPVNKMLHGQELKQ
jgi:hypothetical protein